MNKCTRKRIKAIRKVFKTNIIYLPKDSFAEEILKNKKTFRPNMYFVDIGNIYEYKRVSKNGKIKSI